MKRLVLLLSVVIVPLFMLPAQDMSGKCNGHEYVDLGLSVKWAIYNIGAYSIDEDGDFYAWGEIRTKDSFEKENSRTLGKDLGNIAGEWLYDVAELGSWRMPSKSEWQELIDNCVWEWSIYNHKFGYCVTGKNGKSIFLPASGYQEDVAVYEFDTSGCYWSSDPVDGNTINASHFHFNDSSHAIGSCGRHYGLSVRAVAK
ncbi:MAG: hypothetical protein ACI4AK_04450 [Lepagella sp.]